MDNGYIVRFIRKDDKPVEEFFYYAYSEAIRHLELFQDDNSGLYKRVEIIDSTTFHLPYVILQFQTADRSG